MKRPMNVTHIAILSQTTQTTATASTGEHKPNVKITSKLLNISLQNMVRVSRITRGSVSTRALLPTITSPSCSQYSGKRTPCNILRRCGDMVPNDTQGSTISATNGNNSWMEYPNRNTGIYEVSTTEPH